MEKPKELVPYVLHDIESGNRYTIFIKEADVHRYNNFPAVAYRALAKIKECGQKPDGVWMSLEESLPSTSNSSVWQPNARPASKPKAKNVTVSKPQPKPPKPSASENEEENKTGGRWCDTSVTSLLAFCRPFQNELRMRVVDKKVWASVSASLSSLGLKYNPAQCGEKFRHLKRAYNLAKQGKRNFDYVADFEFLLEKPIEVSATPDDDASGVGGYSSYLRDFPEGEMFHSSAIAVAEKPNESSFRFHTIGLFSPVNESCTTAPHSPPGMWLQSPVEERPVARRLSMIHSDENQLKVKPETDSNFNFNNIGTVSLGDDSCMIILDSPPGSRVPSPVRPATPHSYTTSPTCENFSDLRSPSSKKCKVIGSAVRTPKGRSSPSSKGRRDSTSRRKLPVGQYHLVWPMNVTEDFVKECLRHQKDISGVPVIPLKVWKDISSALYEKGHSGIMWEHCRAKWVNMNTFFLDTLVATGGMLGQNRWPHFDAFLQLNGISISQNGLQEDPNNNSSKLWTDNRILLLIECYKVKKDEFCGKNGTTHATLYSQIADTMQQFTGKDFTSKQCQDQMNELRSKYFKEYDLSHRSGHAPSRWPYMKVMTEVFGRDPNVKAPFISSVGNDGLKYTIDGMEVFAEETGSRTKQLTGKGPKKDTQKKPPAKCWTKQVQEKTFDQRERLFEEVRRIRLTCEASKEQRKIMWDLINQQMFKK